MDPSAMFSAENWAMPFHFWSTVFFVLGCIVGSFLNVCIHRMPLGESIVSPPSHCPHCRYSIPWYLNIPLVTWLYLRGKCANCGAPISVRYFLVELLTGSLFLASWLCFGTQSPWLALAYCVFLAGLIAATFIDFEHFIIPDEITIGGVVAGFTFSLFLPAMHRVGTSGLSLRESLFGIAAGAGLIYLIVRGGKLAFGRQHLQFDGGAKIFFTETSLVLPNEEIPFGEIFYRKTDVLVFDAATLELCDRGYEQVTVHLSPAKLQIGDEVLKPEDVPYMEATTTRVTVPREAMGLGDVKFMAGIGAFIGWQGIIFSIAVSSLIGAVVGTTLIALKKLGKGRVIQYGPYLAMAAAIWIFGGYRWWQRWWDWVLIR